MKTYKKRSISMLNQNTVTSTPSTSTPPSTVALADILQLLDDSGLNFVLHTHHPGTHLEYGNKVSTDPWANTRHECPEAPVLILTGEGAFA
jgi:hypothetical protein